MPKVKFHVSNMVITFAWFMILIVMASGSSNMVMKIEKKLFVN